MCPTSDRQSYSIVLSLKIQLNLVHYCLICGTNLKNGESDSSSVVTPLNHILTSPCFLKNNGSSGVKDIQLLQDGNENISETYFPDQEEKDKNNEEVPNAVLTSSEEKGNWSDDQEDWAGQCDEFFDNKDETEETNRTFTELTLPRFNCDHCEAFFPSNDSLQWHKELAHGTSVRYNCSICNVDFLSLEELSKHISIVSLHQGNKFSCFICKKQVKSLNSHLETHIGQRKYACTVENCDQTFVQKVSLMKHLTCHGESKFHCHVCDNKFIRAENLRHHLKNTHGLEDCFQCTYCNDWFKDYEQLKSHSKDKHKVVKPGKSCCQFCGDYVAPSAIKKHIKENHIKDLQMDFSPCQFCGVRFNCVLMKDHMRDEHPNEVHDEFLDDLETDEIQKIVADIISPKKQHKRKKEEGSQESLSKKKKGSNCPKCGKSFGRKSSDDEMVSNHLSLCGSNLPKLDTEVLKSTFNCKHPDCTAYFRSEDRLIHHNSMMHSDPPPDLQCPVCQLSFKQDWLLLNKHFNSHHKGEDCDFSCQICGARLRSHVDVVKLHYKYHAGLREHKCCACGQEFMESKTLREHERQHLGSKQQGREMVACQHCGKQLLKKNIRYHIDSVHLKVKNSQPRSKAPQQFSCLVCGHKTKASWFRLVDHFLVHTDLGPADTSCLGTKEACGEAFTDLLALHRHYWTVHKNGVECQVCHMVVKNKAYFEGHMTGHSTAKSHHCSHCTKSFKTKIQLDIHEMRHTGQGRYECSICGKRFPQKGEVRNHEMQHGTEKGFTCDHCGKSFTRDAYLRIHMKTHIKKDNKHIQLNKSNRHPSQALLIDHSLKEDNLPSLAGVFD